MNTTDFFLPFFFILSQSIGSCLAVNESAIPVKFGLILNLSSPIGKMSNLCVSMALEDFYSKAANHTKQLVSRVRDSQKNALAAASAGLDLLKKEEVEAIVGPQNSGETDFIANLGDNAHVPIISFSATSPVLSSLNTPYLVRAAQDDSTQSDAIAEIIKSKGWRRVVLIYEDNNYGPGMIPSLAYTFQKIGVITTYKSHLPTFASDLYIKCELYKLMTMQTRVFVVHMGPVLGAQFFRLVHKLGMMSADSAWIITNGVGNLLGDMDPDVIGSMEGVIGLQTYVPRSEKLDDFKTRWMKRFKSQYPEIQNPNLNVYGLWAYDTTWALALAVERCSAGSSKYRHPTNSSDLFALGVSTTGKGLLNAVLTGNFRGLSGDFRLIGGTLQSGTFQVVNVAREGKVKIVGYWDPKSKLRNPTSNESVLGSVIWAGGGSVAPKGWVIATSRTKLKILVPVTALFREFVTVQDSPFMVTGYCIDIFEDVVRALPYALHYEFVPSKNRSQVKDWSYNFLIDQIYHEEYDALVGDVTIIGNRSKYVDFTLPYSDSGVSMIVPVRASNKKKASVFLEPLTPQLWCASAAFFVFTGIVIWLLEHRINPNFRGPPSEQIGLIFYYGFSTMVFAHNVKLTSNLARIVVEIWVFAVLILTSSYTASLASILTVQQLQPTVTDLQILIKQRQRIGYQSGSFVHDMLKMMGASNEHIIGLHTDQEYADALRNETVIAIVDEIPYIKVFLSKHCTRFMMVFPMGSLLVSDFSRAILNVTQSESMSKIEKKWFGSQTTCADVEDKLTSNRLPLYSFRGLFLLTGTISLGAMIVFFFHFILDYLKSNASRREGFWQKIKSIARHFDNKDLSSNTFKKERLMNTLRRDCSKVHDISANQELENESHGSLTVIPTTQIEGNQDPDQEIIVENRSVHEGSIRLVVQC